MRKLWLALGVIGAVGLILLTVKVFGPQIKLEIRKLARGISGENYKVALKKPPAQNGSRVIFLHHSTGRWGGLAQRFRDHRKKKSVKYWIVEQRFLKARGNYPYDYWDIWVRHEGDEPWEGDPTLEMITQTYDVIVWKYCYPVSDIKEDVGAPSIHSSDKRLENYRLQYEAVKGKMRQFPDCKFIVWTGPAQVKTGTTVYKAERAR